LSPGIKKIVHLLTALVVFFLIAEISYPAEQDFFAVYNLEVEGEIHDYLSGDFNGDRLTDIAVIYSPINDLNNRYAGIHLQKGALGFGSKADYLIPLPSAVVQADAGDIDGDGQSEILFIDFDGVLAVKYSAGTGFSNPVRIIRQNTVYSLPLFFGIIAQPFLFDIVSSPGPEIIVPTARGYAIFERGDDRTFQILNQLDISFPCRSISRGLKDFSGRSEYGFNICLASIAGADGNLDGRQDLYFLWDRKLYGFFQDSTGNFAQTPDFEVNFYPPGGEAYLQSRLTDLNGDKRPDAAVSVATGGITKAEAKLRFYLADSRGKIAPQYKKEISLSDTHCNLTISDFNADNIKEVAIPAVELGAIAVTKMLLLKKADLNLLIYPLVNGVPEDEPAQRINYSFRFNFDEAIPTGEVALDWNADFNGDNLSDMVFSDGAGHLQFFWGKREGYLSKKPDLEVFLDHPSEMHPFHLNQGKSFDLVVESNLKGKIDRLTILKNRNNKM
jgi:hypothetical protein